MTKHRFFTGFAPAKPLATALVLLLALPLTGVQAQGLKPSGASSLRLPSASASPAPTGQASGQQSADFIVVVVNSEPITNNEVRTKLMRTELQFKQQGLAIPPRSELVPQLLERMILDKAQLQAAQASGLKVDDSAVDAAVLSIASQNQINLDELRRRLKADGIDYQQFRAELRDELLVTRLRQREVESKASVSEQEIDQYLRDQQSGASASANMLNLGEILLPLPENATPEQLAAQQAKAQKVLERARAGGDFAALAAEFSASKSRGEGGQMGLRSAERYPPLFVEATKNLRAGELAGPVRSGAGLHILKVLEKKQGGVPDAVVTQTHARHILLRLRPKFTEAAAVEKLAAFKKRIEAGQADFAALARENSQDGSAKQGGDLGWAAPGMFVPEFEATMNALGPNQISEPLVSRFGVHLLQVLERREAPLSEREQRETVRELLRGKKQNEAYALWAQELRGRAYVELRELPQ
ncbi:MAG: peptidylprolyl isomerase [Polaromonas sp.]|nr:peptidylprolyl isomerase [Polaromonas sp.]